MARQQIVHSLPYNRSFNADLPRKMHSPREQQKMSEGYHSLKDSFPQQQQQQQHSPRKAYHRMVRDNQSNHHRGSHHIDPSSIIPDIGLIHHHHQHQPIHRRILNRNPQLQLGEENVPTLQGNMTTHSPQHLTQSHLNHLHQQPLEMIHQHQQQRSSNQPLLLQGKQNLAVRIAPNQTFNDSQNNSRQLFQGRMSLEGDPSIANNNNGRIKSKLSSLNGAPSLR